MADHSENLQGNSALHNFMLYVCMILISIVAVLVLGEIVVRAIAPQSIIPRFVESAPYGIRKVLGNVNAQHITPEYRYTYTSNSMGFRGSSEYSLRADKNVYRIVIQGDSVTLGHGVGDRETYSYFLEEKFSLIGLKVEVLNLGVSGFGTAEEIIQYENVAINYSPDLVILGYFQNDDMNNHVSQLYGLSDGELIRISSSFQPGLYMRDRIYKIPFYSFLSQKSHLFTFIRTQASALIINSLKEQNFSGIERKTNEGATEQASELTRRLLQKYAHTVTSSGSDLIILDITDKNMRTDFPVDVDFGNRVKTIATKPTFSENQNETERLFYEVDAHPTVAGHQLIAQVLYEYILAEAFPDDMGNAESSIFSSADEAPAL